MAGEDAQILSRWDGNVRGTTCTPLTFFELVADEIQDQEVPDIGLVYTVRREGGLFSSRRAYLRIRHQDLFFDVSAFVVGRNLTVGYWLHRDHPGVADLFREIPGIGFAVDRWIRPTTYYQVDYIDSFQQLVHGCILDVVDRLRNALGSDPLTDQERAPIWENIW